MTNVDDCPLAGVVSARLRSSRNELTTRWLERISARVSVDKNRIFPTNELLDHVPLLIDGIAAFVEDPSSAVSADMQVVEKARELGALRHAQGFDQFEILKEFELLGNILLLFVGTVAEESPEPCGRAQLVACAQRVFQAVQLIQQATSTQYMHLLMRQISEREQRLRAFNRALTQSSAIASVPRSGPLRYSSSPISRTTRSSSSPSSSRATRSACRTFSRICSSYHASRTIHAAIATCGFAKPRPKLRVSSRHGGAATSTIRIAPDLPAAEVNAAAVELCLTNLMSNAIKYSLPDRTDSWVEVRGRIQCRRWR